MTRSRRAEAGQHFLASSGAASRVVGAARIGAGDTVYEAGTGTGALVPLLCAAASRVISVESDARLHAEALERLGGLPGLELRHADAFASDEGFDVFVSSLPYSQSRRAFEWMARQDFGRGAVIVQREFAEKVMAGPPGRRAIGVITSAAFEVSRVAGVGRESFVPPPRVDSVILSLRRRATLERATVAAINSLFSYRRKTMRSALRLLGAAGGGDERVGDLGVGEIVRVARSIAR